MIDYGAFQFASPPRTSTTWIRHALLKTGHQIVDGNSFTAHGNFLENYTTPRLSCARHPENWLKSIYVGLEGGVVSGPKEVVDVCQLAKISDSFVGFVSSVVEQPGLVGKAFAVYRATSVIKVEDLPYSLIAFLLLFGELSPGTQSQIVTQGLLNKSKPKKRMELLDLPLGLRRKLMAAEEEYCDRYEYY